MGDNRLDPLEVDVRGGVRTGQHGGRVEDVEAFVFHRAHVEIVNGHNVENIEVVFAAINLFIPFHRLDQALHGEGTFALITGPDPYIELHVAPGGGGELAGMIDQIACHERKEVGGLGPGIVPFREAVAGRTGISVGEQHGL